MMKKVFISYSFAQKSSFESFHPKLKNFLEGEYGVSVYAFVFDFTEKVDDKTLMEKAFAEIDSSDYVFIELSNKSVGVAVEAGYAKAKGKKVIYLYKKGTDLQQTVNGIADHIIPYDGVDDVISWISSNQKFLDFP